MSTFAQVCDRIALDYLNRSDLLPETKRAVNRAIKTYEAERYWFNEASTAVACTSSQTYVTVPADFLSLDRLEVTVNSADYVLVDRSFNTIRDLNVTRFTGRPIYYAYHGDRFELSPVPNSNYSLNVYYIKSLPTLSADSDTNEWITALENQITHTAVLDLLTTVVDGDEKKIAKHNTFLQLAFNETAKRRDTRLAGRLRHTYF